MKKIKNIVSVVLFTVLVLAISLGCILKPTDAFSAAERRALAQLPELNFETIFSGAFMDGFETYTADQFPLRDTFRAFKAGLNKYIFGKRDTNGLFMADGHISKIDDPLNGEMLSNAADRFSYLHETYLKGTDAKIYFSVVPDKNYWLANANRYPALDYEALVAQMREKTDYMQYIDIIPLLGLEDYYTTDTHWKQENITDVAEYILSATGAPAANYGYTVHTLEVPFYGVYSGQLPLKTAPDTIQYLSNAVIDGCVVTYYDTGKPVVGAMYNMDKAAGKDPYEMFLSGSAPLVTIENPNAPQQRELVIFRDSYGSSLAPLLAQGYSKTTVVDIRYIQSSFVGNFVDFESCDDVLFLYSSSLLNNSLALR